MSYVEILCGGILYAVLFEILIFLIRIFKSAMVRIPILAIISFFILEEILSFLPFVQFVSASAKGLLDISKFVDYVGKLIVGSIGATIFESFKKLFVKNG